MESVNSAGGRHNFGGIFCSTRTRLMVVFEHPRCRPMLLIERHDLRSATMLEISAYAVKRLLPGILRRRRSIVRVYLSPANMSQRRLVNSQHIPVSVLVNRRNRPSWSSSDTLPTASAV